MNCVMKSRRYIRKEGRKIGKNGTYYGLGCLVNMYMEQNRIREVVLAELSRIRWNLAEYGRLLQIAVRLPSHGWSLVAKSVETGGCV